MNFDLDSLLNGSSSPTSVLDPTQLLAPLMPFFIIMTVISLVITVLYIVNVINMFRSHRATIEMRNILREMNERDKARSSTNPAVD